MMLFIFLKRNISKRKEPDQMDGLLISYHESFLILPKIVLKDKDILLNPFSFQELINAIKHII